jgi:hypothetical protein
MGTGMMGGGMMMGGRGMGMGGGMMGMGGGMGMGGAGAFGMGGGMPMSGAAGRTLSAGGLAIGGTALPGFDRSISGLLTAGSFNDNLDPRSFLIFADKMKTNRDLGDLPGKMRGQLVVIVKDESGNPLGNARVRLEGKGASAEMITRSNGQAIFLRSWDRLPADQALTVTVIPPFGAPPLTEIMAAGKSHSQIVLPKTQAHLPRSLDLAIVLDTTGSMADELEYIKGEIGGIVTALRKKFPGVIQRLGLVLYRDEGDEYVARKFDFTTSLEKFQRQLAGQSAAGGGDYPEAVHRGFEEAQTLSWQESDTARVLLWLADAPPHSEFMSRTMAAADALRKKGVVFYPVACSGYDDNAEFIMRSCALLTGGQFLFLTDDSGVGDAHAEPKIPSYRVERLEKLIIRMVAGELAGRPIDAQPRDVIRTVGKKSP